jgi:hypothetical protein
MIVLTATELQILQLLREMKPHETVTFTKQNEHDATEFKVEVRSSYFIKKTTLT